MKNATIDSSAARTRQFQEIVEALGLLPDRSSWDLNWGEPFIAVSRDRKTWVRIFYEESAPLSGTRLSHEIERMLPLLPEGGDLNFCFPQVWDLSEGNLFEEGRGETKFWKYKKTENRIMARRISREAEADVIEIEAQQPVTLAAPCEERLASDEIRELAEMGLLLKRQGHKKAF